ncbi:hypothetical protein GCM10023350_53030 [Nocardioides endophyticus]|uniref:ABC transporter permease n=1 Tax=Nocardioides endophyticus TaxID=1353775 RepID=A0ABP8ZNJ8_9ACTN
MTEQPHPPIGAAAYLNLATRMFGPGFSGEGTLSVIASTQIHGSDHASITETATISAAGVVASKPVGAQVWTFLARLSPGQLLAVYVYLQANSVVGLQDPEALMYSVLLTLPFVALVVRAINQRR